MLFSELKENITILVSNMKKTSQYFTRIVSIGYDDIHYYFIDEQDSTIQEFFDVLDKGFNGAVKNRHLLFKKYETFETDVELRICLN